MIGYIYLTTTVDEEYYIGQHKKSEFDCSYKGSGKLLKGKDILSCKMIDTADSLKELNNKERYWIERCASKMGDRCLNLGSRASSGSQNVCVNLKTKEAYYDMSIVAKRYKVSEATVSRWINRYESEPIMYENSRKKKRLKKYQRELMYDWVLMSMKDYMRVKDHNIV